MEKRTASDWLSIRSMSLDCLSFFFFFAQITMRTRVARRSMSGAGKERNDPTPALLLSLAVISNDLVLSADWINFEKTVHRLSEE
jgi:hypothetical protein